MEDKGRSQQKRACGRGVVGRCGGGGHLNVAAKNSRQLGCGNTGDVNLLVAQPDCIGVQRVLGWYSRGVDLSVAAKNSRRPGCRSAGDANLLVACPECTGAYGSAFKRAEVLQ